MPKYNFRLLTPLLFGALLYSSCGQRPNGQQPQDERTAEAKEKEKGPFEAKDHQAPAENVSFWDCGEYIRTNYNTKFPVTSLGSTYDYGHIFSNSQVKELDLAAFDLRSKSEIAIVTIDSTCTSKESFNDLAHAIAKDWHAEKHRKSRVLMVISKLLNEIEIVSNHAIDAKLTEAEKDKVINEIILPEFMKGNYFEGTKKGILALKQEANEK